MVDTIVFRHSLLLTVTGAICLCNPASSSFGGWETSFLARLVFKYIPCPIDFDSALHARGAEPTKVTASSSSSYLSPLRSLLPVRTTVTQKDREGRIHKSFRSEKCASTTAVYPAHTQTTAPPPSASKYQVSPSERSSLLSMEDTPYEQQRFKTQGTAEIFRRFPTTCSGWVSPQSRRVQPARRLSPSPQQRRLGMSTMNFDVRHGQ